MRGLGLCQFSIEAGLELPSQAGAPIKQFEGRVATQRLVIRANEPLDHVPIVCEGWGAVVEYLPTGRRQILAFRLPGEFIATGLVFATSLYRDVEAVTPVLYRNFDRAALRDTLQKSPELVERVVANCIAEKERADHLIVDLGQRRAEQRIARLILQIMDRMTKCGMITENTVRFPLRQIHIADALGMTAAYVNQIL
jgi:CRP-like cAMP-binding protein